MTTAEVVRVLSVTIEEVRCLTRNGELRALKLGGSRSGQTRIPPEDLLAYQRRLHGQTDGGRRKIIQEATRTTVGRGSCRAAV